MSRTRTSQISARNKTVAFGALALAALVAGRAVRADTYTWSDTSTDWGLAASWSPGTGPPGASDLAVFPAAAGVANQPSIGATDRSILGITIDNTGGAAYSISGTANLTIGLSGLSVTGAGTTSVLGTGQVILGTNQTWTVGDNARVQVPNLLTGASLSKAGNGILELGGNNGTGTLNTINLNAGTLRVTGATNGLGSASSSVNVVNNTTLQATTAATSTQAAQIFVRAGAFTIDATGGANSLTLSGPFNGMGSVTKTGGGRLILGSTNNTFVGPYTLTGGTIQLGSTTAGIEPQLIFRSNAVNLMPGTLLTAAADLEDVRFGELLGSGTVDTSTLATNQSGIVQTVLRNATSAATVSTTAVALQNGWTVQGSGTQTLTGNLALVFGQITLFGNSTGAGSTTAGMLLAGSAALTSGNSISLVLRGGTLTLDNQNGNTGAGNTTDRFGDGRSVNSFGGTLSLLGNGANGSAEAVGILTLTSGATTFNVTHNGGSSGTQLTFNSLARPGANNRSTVNFTNSGGTGTLGTTGANPRIVFVDQPNPNSFIGPWATVNGNDYAYNGTNLATGTGIRVQPYDTVYTDLGAANPGSTTFNSLEQTTTNATKSGAGNFDAAALRILPGGPGRTLDITGSGNLNVGGILLAGPDSYTIRQNGGSGGLSAPGISAPFPRYYGVAQTGTTLTISAPIFTPGGDLVKYGDGFLDLTADNSGTLNALRTNYVLNAGTLRVTLGANGSLPTNGTVGVAFRGGVLEIANGANGTGTSADFKLPLGTTSTTAGVVSWSNGVASDRGGGGFSAINSDASVNIGGSASPQTMVWDRDPFVPAGHALIFGSTQATNRITFLNPIDLDGGTAGAYNAREIYVNKNPVATGDVARLAGLISGTTSTDLLKTGPGVLELPSSNSYQGNTLVVAGTLHILNGSGLATGGGVVVARESGTVDGTGIIGRFAVRDGGTVSPGVNGPGKLTSGLTMWDAAGRYRFEINDAAGTAGTNWDLLSSTSLLDITATTGSKFVIELRSLTAANQPGNVANFNSASSYQWTLAMFAGSIQGFSPDLFLLDTTNFTNSLGGGSFTIVPMGNTLVLEFTPSPEPGHVLLLCAAGSGLVALARRRLRRV